MSKGYQCDGCDKFTKKPVKIKYPTSNKKLDYLGVSVSEKDLQDDNPKAEHYCIDCITIMKEALQ